ncbi:PH domain-containing protein [Lysobacter silvisoli]|uniref:YdbS-like PH domain-containing protein n=1 Tax=Lysobacter silvisoli TaxID=2293254 RepID=A0A371K0Q1_9GAMM|nr:PH domain-containing protein [Lysobacter silvisoli]RDZ27498.1 hypothetical protein DX914_14840 [Lysobacter silvisoli]
MTTPEAGADGAGAPTAAEAASAERRLHPMSWLFVLLQQLRQFIVPLIALLVFGRGDRNELWSLLAVGVLVVLSLWQYFTYRYGTTGDSLVVRSGLLERSLRVIPFARIHNVALRQSALHRLFGVAEVRLESAGGAKPEAEMRVLKMADALALEALVRRRGSVEAAASAEPAETTLLTMSVGDVVRLGVVNNRGMFVVGAGVAAFMPYSREVFPNDIMPREVGQFVMSLFGWTHNHHFGPLQYVLGALLLIGAVLAAVRLLSVLLALLQYYGFRLSEHGRRLTVERGLLARWRTSASRRRIQAWTLREGVLHRLLRRRSLEIETAVGETQDQERALRELAPIATPAACEALIEHLLPRAGWRGLDWRALPLASWWRLFVPGLPWLAIITAALCWRFGAWGLLALAWLPWAAFKARQRARRIGYAVNEELVAVREGWWSRHWRFAEIDKLQALQLSRSPVDRRCGTATLWLDTAGAGALAPPLRIRFLPVTEAEALYRRLSAMLAARKLRW